MTVARGQFKKSTLDYVDGQLHNEQDRPDSPLFFGRARENARLITFEFLA